jgi:hypothetical protein
MGGHDDFGIEKLRVDPALMRRVLGQQARNSKRKGWQRICTVLPRAWELRLLEAKRVSTYRLAIELLYLHWYGKGKPVTVSSMVAKAAKLSGRSKSRALAELERLVARHSDFDGLIPSQFRIGKFSGGTMSSMLLGMPG